MRRWIALVSGMIAFMPVLLSAQVGSGTGSVVVIRAGEIDAEVLEVLTNSLQRNVFCRIRVAPPLPPFRLINDSIRGAVAKRMANSEVALVVTDAAGELSFIQEWSVSSRMAFLNIFPLKSGPGESVDTFKVRLEKQATMLSAFVLGLKPCVFPLCAGCPVTTLEELDAKGRNLCPPCQIHLEELLGVKDGDGLPPETSKERSADGKRE